MAESKKVIVVTDASGAVKAARQGLAVMIVDVIDMSTTLEGALEAGALKVFGASPDVTAAPVEVNPYRIGKAAALAAKEYDTTVIVIAEPRVGTDEKRLRRCSRLMAGLKEGEAVIEAVIPNLGAETAKLVDFNGRIAVAVTDTGGVAFDAAYQITELVGVGTIARTIRKKGEEPAKSAARRAQELMMGAPGIAVVAASGNSLEDILAAKYIAELIQQFIGRQLPD